MAVGARGLEEVVERLTAQLAERERSHVKFRTLVALAGQKRKSALLVDRLEQALAEAQIFHYPLSLKNCQLEDTILVSVKPFRERGLPFANEAELSEFIVRHYRSLPPFARCTSVVREQRWGDVRLDLVFRERGGGYVVCELEHGAGRFETASQLKRYIEAVHASLLSRGRTARVRGVVVTGKENPEQEAEMAQWSLESGFPVNWYYYRLTLELEPAPL